MEAFDVVIVGSGFGGSIPALRLAGQGRRVLVLEQGERLTTKDFPQDWGFRAQTRLFNAYTSKDYRVFMRYGKGLGGGSLIYAAAMLRSPSEAFEFRDKTGYRVWPTSVTRQVLDPYYAKVEAMMHISRASWADVPKAGGCFAMLLDKMGLTCDRTMYPIVDCLQCGFCMTGCPFGKKKHLGHNYIPQAETLGAEFRTGCKVHHLEKDGEGYAVHYADVHNVAQSVRSDLLILAASALESPAIFLRSKPYLSGLHPQVGKNFNQNGDVALVFLLPEGFPKAYGYLGRNNAGVITYAFWDEHRITIHAGAGPPALFAALDVVREGGRKPDVPLGLEFKHFLKQNYPDRLISSLAIGLVDGDGEVSVNSQGLVEFDVPMNETLKAYIDRVAGVGRRIAQETGAELLRTSDESFEHGDAHPLATVRMGDDADRAPCDPNGEIRSHRNIFVTDGACIPGGTGVNPAHTIAANAERIAEWITQNR
ncbi:MAG: GMC family oxidoreductase [Deltaproteobacteria bacterium]|nr:GMC family oxidoreductase [Deltaproteobacteria bacterium]